MLSRTLHWVARISLTITLVLAVLTMFRSPDMAAYIDNRDIFYRYGFICTVAYFVTAYWALRRKKALQT